MLLIIDDNLQIRLLYRTYLEVLGYFISEAASMEAAISRLCQTRMDLTLADLIMSGMSGAKGLQII